MKQSDWKNIEIVFAVLVFLGIVSFLFWRIHFGVDFTDEALYSAAPYRFFLGDQPFRDDFFVYQLSALLIYPFIKFFCLLQGGTDGIIFYVRCLYLLFTGVISLSLFFTLEKDYPFLVRFLLVLIYWVFVPFKIFSLGYNALAIGFLSLAFFHSRFAQIPANRSQKIFFGALGFLQGLGVFAYPSLVLTFIPPALYFFRKYGIKSLFLYFFGAILVPVIFFISFGIRISDFLSSAQFIANASGTSGHTWTIGQIFVLLESSLELFHYPLWHLIWIVGFTYAVKKQNTLLKIVLGIALPILAFFSNSSVIGGAGERGYLIEFALLGIYFFWLINRNAEDWKIFHLIYVPSLFAGITFAWSSNNGVPHAALGLLPAALLSHLWLFRIMLNKKTERSFQFVALIPLALTLCMLLREDRTVFLEDSIKALNTKVENGIYKGIYTSEKKKKYWDEMYLALEKDRNTQTGVILFSPHFPAGYLMTKMKPATYTVWGDCQDGFASCVDSFKKKAKSFGIFVRVRSLYFNQDRTDIFHSAEQKLTLMQLESPSSPKEEYTDFDVYRVATR